MRKEPTFVRKIHEEREVETRVLYEQFHGNVAAWLAWMEKGNAADAQKRGDRAYHTRASHAQTETV